MYRVDRGKSAWKEGTCARQRPWFTLLCFSPGLTYSLSLVILSLHCARLAALGSLHRPPGWERIRSGATEG